MQNKPSKKNGGLTLIELLVTLSVVGILATVAVPNFRDMLLKRDLNKAQNTLVQTLRQAKMIARSESTTVEVVISSNKITLTPQNSDKILSFKLPSVIETSSEIAINFNARGLAVKPGENNIEGETNITIQADSDNSISQTVIISPMGAVSIL